MPAAIPHDEIVAVLDLLTRRARVATDSQLSHYYNMLPGVVRSWAAVRRELDRQGFLCSGRFQLRLPTVEIPLARWDFDQPPPNFDQLAWQLVKRFSDAHVACHTVHWASVRAARLTQGIGGSLRQPDQIEHDLGTTDIYLRFLQQSPDLAELWVSEDLLRRDHQKLFPNKIPDASLLDGDRVRLILETAGQYGAARLRAFHRFCRQRRFPYEIW